MGMVRLWNECRDFSGSLLKSQTYRPGSLAELVQPQANHPELCSVKGLPYKSGVTKEGTKMKSKCDVGWQIPTLGYLVFLLNTAHPSPPAPPCLRGHISTGKNFLKTQVHPGTASGRPTANAEETGRKAYSRPW